jgi:hypothetical protein
MEQKFVWMVIGQDPIFGAEQKVGRWFGSTSMRIDATISTISRVSE